MSIIRLLTIVLALLLAGCNSPEEKFFTSLINKPDWSTTEKDLVRTLAELNPSAMYAIAIRACAKNDEKECMEWASKAANAGHPLGTQLLGLELSRKNKLLESANWLLVTSKYEIRIDDKNTPPNLLEFERQIAKESKEIIKSEVNDVLSKLSEEEKEAATHNSIELVELIKPKWNTYCFGNKIDRFCRYYIE